MSPATSSQNTSNKWRADSQSAAGSPARLPRFALTILAVLLIACSHQSGYTIQGIVIDRDETHSQLTIAHESVPGLMPAMTMPFRIAKFDPSVQIGYAVKGNLVLTKDGDGWIENLTITKRSAPAPITQKQTLAPGAQVPEFHLINQDGKPINLRGQNTILTFIYTRCPFPNFCPLMMKNFNAIRKLNRDIHLVSITIDPEYDTPGILKAWGSKMIPGPDPFANWDLATGSQDEIGRIATWFGLTYFKESGQITHSLVTAVIDKNARVIKILPENTWRPEDALM